MPDAIEILFIVYLIGTAACLAGALLKCADDADGDMGMFLVTVLGIAIWIVPFWPIILPFYGIGKALGVRK